MNFNTLAAIDIGSNAVRLLINNIEDNKGIPEFKKVAFLRVPIRLGEDTFVAGEIGESKLQRLNEAMLGFAHIMKAYKVSCFRACATSAMRDAKNGQEVIGHIKDSCGIEIDIITGKEEAEIIFEAGGLNSVMDKSKNYLYVDVGGGSTEIIIYSKQQKVASQSFQIGTVRMLADVVKKEEKDFFKEWLKDTYKKYAPLSIIASGGNINKVHKLLGKRERESLNYTEVKVLYDTLSQLSYDERIENFKLNAYRADVIIPAMKIFLTVGKICKINEIFVPKVGLVDGIIHHLYTNSQDCK